MKLKRYFLAGVMILASSVAGRAADDTYYNGGLVTTPPVIDATNFVNEGVFSIATELPFEFSSVLNYTNRNQMRNGFLDEVFVTGGLLFTGSPGFRFDTAPPTDQSWPRHMAANFYNAPLVGNVATNASIYGDFQLLVSATNIVNHGALRVSEYGLVSLDGKTVDTSRGILQTSGFAERGSTTPEGIFDQYWFFGTNELRPQLQFTALSPYTPFYDVIVFPSYFTNTIRQPRYTIGAGSNGLTSAEFIYQSGTNRSVQIVFVRNSNPNITTRIASAGGSPTQLGIPIIEWAAVNTNRAGVIQSNMLYLTDTYGYSATNAYLTNYPYAPPPPHNTAVQPLSFQPSNFEISRTAPFNLAFADAGTPFTDKPADFWGTGGSPIVVTSAQYSAYGVVVAPTPTTSASTNAIRGGPGRVEIKASRLLDTSLSQVAALSYVKLQATNHFVNSSNSSISAPYADIALGSTNGNLDMTSVLEPYVTRCNGPVDAYSAVWTNAVAFGGSTNSVIFNVLFVDSLLNDRAAMQIFDASLRATNLVVGDNLNAIGSLSLDVDRLTVLTNGSISIGSLGIQWDKSASHLNALTNYGLIAATNTINFYAHNANSTPRAYGSLANFGNLTAGGMTVWATNLVNQGTMNSLYGPLSVQAVSDLSLNDGGLLSAIQADVSLSGRNVTVSNHTIYAGRTLRLSVTNQLVAGTNTWQVLDGISLPIKPAAGDLSYVTIRSQAIPFQNAVHTWAGTDRGAQNSGFTNNAALGVLALNGAANSLFTFTGTGAASNAIYIDRLELINSAGLFDANGNLAELSIAPGMTVYYAQATIDGASAAEFMNGKNGGRLRWISSYAGPFSGTNVVYPNGSTNFLNAALVTSCNLDSDNDGLPNCIDPSPVFLPQLARVDVSVVTSPSRMLVLSWLTIGGATNHIYSATNTGSPNWQLVTNLVSPPVVGKPFTNQFVTPLTSGSRFYKVSVEAP
ncbi:MAG TPA: hypothetical protein VFV96_07645 [Verrucomicrobiae bacterium]|nr:hypothetical protein [Verrucomicrobiae bacterium]